MLKNFKRTKPLTEWLCGAAVLCGLGCGDVERMPAPPPPLPVATAPAVPQAPEAPVAEAPATPVAAAPEAAAAAETKPSEPAVAAVATARKPKPGASVYDREPKPKATTPSPAQPVKPPIKIDLSKIGAGGVLPLPKPEPANPAPAPTSYAMPGSAQVKIDAPKGLQADLAKDPRMKPWLEKGVAAATQCYQREAKNNPQLSGTIVVSIVMHENDRPDASIQTLPSQLSGIFACLTGAMMKSRMPLFTGQEGQKYTARVAFKP